MARVRMVTGIAGEDWSVQPGDLFTCDEATALRLIAAGAAEAVDVRENAMQQMAQVAARVTKRPAGRA